MILTHFLLFKFFRPSVGGPHTPDDLTQQTPGAFPGGILYGSFSGRTPTLHPGAFTLEGLLNRVGGGGLHTLFELTVTEPVEKTWYLATVDLATPTAGFADPDVFDPGTFATGLTGTIYWGLIRTHSGVSASAAVGGVAGQTGVSLDLINALGTGGPGRRFMDTFVTNVPGYDEPYDLLTATLRCRLYHELLPGEPLTIGASFAIVPSGFEWSSAPGQMETVRLAFGPDDRRYLALPKRRVTKTRYPHAPDSSINQPITPWFADEMRVPMLPLDADGSLWLVGASPTATRLGGVPRLWTIRPDPGSKESGDKPQVYPVKITTGGESVLAIPGTGTNQVTLKQAAMRFELETDGAFIYAVTLRLRRSSGGTACDGSISMAVVLDEDGLPGQTLVDRNASAEITAAIVTTGVFTNYTIPFQANKESRAAYLPPNRGLWLVVSYAKTSGDMQINTDPLGPYAKGVMATKDTASDSAWILTGKQQRRSPVRSDYTGIGQLGRNVSTGEIKLRPPVTIPGS